MAAPRLEMGSERHAAVILGLSSLLTVTWGLVLERPLIEGPHISLVNTYERFDCWVPNAPNTDAILYQLYQKKAENDSKSFGKRIGERTGHGGSGVYFDILTKAHHDGNYFCKASVLDRSNGSSVPPTFSDALYLKVIEPVEGAELVSDPPLAEVFEGRGLTLTCAVKKGTHVSYRWFHNGAPSQNKAAGNRLYVARVGPADAGNYTCLATNRLNDTVYSSTSNQTFIRVKVPVSKPEISLTVLKERGGISANVTCRALAGTPPLSFTFTLRNGTQERRIVRQEHGLSASVTLPIALNRNEGRVLCHASNGLDTLASDTLDLEVVPVGGAVTLTAKQVRRYFKVEALALHCGLERGTFPRFRWLLNDTTLERHDGHFGHTLHLPSIAARSSGFYQCVATDSFDETNRISSEKLFIDKKALEHVSVAVVSVVFGCFLFLVCLVAFCCVYGVLNRRRLPPQKPRPAFVSPETDNLETEDEEPVEGEYMEDEELVRAANIDYPEKGEEHSVESVDEWPEIERALQISCMDETVPPR